MCYYEEPIEELHRLLDERGVEWSATTGSAETIWTHWRTFNGYIVSAMDNGDGTLKIFDEWDVTPAQAIAATLGEPITDTEKVIEYLRQENVDWEDRYRALAAENVKLRNEVDNLRDLEYLTSVAVAYAGCDECGEYKQTMLSLFDENTKLRGQYETVLADYRSEVAKLRELVRDLYSVLADYRSEVAKLRELVKHMLTHIKFTNEDTGEPMCWRCPYGKSESSCDFEQRAAALGVEGGSNE